MESIATEQAATPGRPPHDTGRVRPVSRSAANGGPAGNDTRTGCGLAVSHAATSDPLAGNSSGFPLCVARTGTCPPAACLAGRDR